MNEKIDVNSVRDHIPMAEWNRLRLERLADYQKVTEEAIRRGNGEIDLVYRALAKSDLFFLELYILGWDFANNDWWFRMSQVVSAEPDECIDIWAREHGKSSQITIAKTIQDVLNDPYIMACILSFNRPTAKRFLRIIKSHFETNERLKRLFPDIFYSDPIKDAPKWSEDDGIVVKRDKVMPHLTVEAYGVIDSMPTGGHYTLLIYDDVVTKEAVSSPEMIDKVTDAVSLSFNLASIQKERKRFIGTRYHYSDTYQRLIDRGVFKTRIYAATEDGKLTGEPVLWDRDTLDKKVKAMGPSVAAAQLFCRPVLEGEDRFSPEWIQYWVVNRYDHLNRYILVDPANEKNKKSDWTVMMVVGLGSDMNYYIIDIIRDKLDVKERAETLIQLHRQYKPLDVGYERYGIQSDIQFIKEKQNQYQYRFGITELGGNMSKADRIMSLLQPLYAEKRIFLPDKRMRKLYDGTYVDVVQAFINEEYLAYPYVTHDDALDCLARINDPAFMTRFPKETKSDDRDRWAKKKEDEGEYSFNTFDGLNKKRYNAHERHGEYA